ncbi:MAG: Hsp70 family protein [Kofleriaceae bacterium]
MADDVPVGIDLGTTNSVVAAYRDGAVTIVPDADGNYLHPSVVTFKPSGERLAGAAARLRRIVDPGNTIFSMKRLMGLPFESAEVQSALASLPYRVEAGPDGAPAVITRAGPTSVVELSSAVLGHLRDLSERHLGAPVRRCVITVPANFSDGQREATRRAAELAGLEVLRILNEPTAAALAYGLGKEIDSRVVVFDMGGGTFDVTLLAVRDDFFEVLSTGGDPFLGGDDVDRAIVAHLAELFLAQHRLDFRTDAKTLAIASVAAEHIKSKLSSAEVTSGSLKGLGVGVGGVPLGLDFELTRAQLEALVSPLVDRALIKCEEVLYEAGVGTDRVDEIMLVGGATRMPLVRRRVAELFGRPPLADLDPMVVVAHGAAVHAAALGATAPAPGEAPPPPMPILVDVTPHAIGIGTAGGYAEVLIEKNQPIPAERTQIYTTARDGQAEVMLKICQGSERQFAANAPLGEVKLEGLRPGNRGEIKVEVTFLVDSNGILQVSARDVDTGHVTRATLRAIAGEVR